MEEQKNPYNNKGIFTDAKRFKHSLILPVLYVMSIWIVKFFEIVYEVRFVEFGILPRKLSGLIGIVCSPFIHSDFDHLYANSIPLLVLGIMMFYFYRSLGYKIFFLTLFMSGFWLWLGGRSSYHIGASGMVYAIASFLFFSGVLRKYYKLLTISLVVVFLYGSLVWGILPIVKETSWEGHLFGAIAGLITAVIFRKEGPRRKPYDWELEDDDEDEEPPINSIHTGDDGIIRITVN